MTKRNQKNVDPPVAQNGQSQVVHLPGADVALSQSPTPRQLAWLHEVYTQKLCCCCMSFATAWYFATFLVGITQKYGTQKSRALARI
jgi:hypothetical protein